ncbi:hypothetical protein FVE24_18185 [Parageobacillus sp. SY1]|nr:hypothetical protein FVE24_18185 [Parageobacillus sp. SY1]
MKKLRSLLRRLCRRSACVDSGQFHHCVMMLAVYFYFDERLLLIGCRFVNLGCRELNKRAKA